MKKELYIFIVLFLLLSLTMHFDAWLSAPLEQIENLAASPLGIYHPLYITFAVYLLILIVRFVVRFVKQIFSSKS